MKGVFDDREFQQAETRRDTELTLSSVTLLLIFFGLVLLCGLCFGLGYARGRHGAAETAAALPGGAGAEQAAPTEAGGRAKPSANTQQVTARPNAAGDQDAAAQTDSGRLAAASPAPAAASAQATAQPLVKPAFAATDNPVQAAQLPQATVTPAMGSLMVQIAAVSQQEDADVLVGALRRRGYEVAAHREPLDGLIHVRTGPFKTRAEAETWRQKLLNDGYNAIVQP